MTDLTDEAVKALLDGATPGPWAADETDPSDVVVWAHPDKAQNDELIANVGHRVHPVALAFDCDGPNARLMAAAPDLARALLGAGVENDRLRADAKAAVALVVEKAAGVPGQMAAEADAILAGEGPNKGVEILRDTAVTLRDAIRALAPVDGLATVEALRKERDEWKAVSETLSEMQAGEYARAEALAAATMLTKEPQQTWVFDRYVSGVLMAEDVEVTRASSFEEAAVIAARLASRGPNGESPVLVSRTALDAKARVAALEKVGRIREEEWATFRDALISERDRRAADLAAAQAQIEALRDVYWKLRSYAFHDDGCKLNKPPYKVGSCSCGLTSALARGEAALAALPAKEGE